MNELHSHDVIRYAAGATTYYKNDIRLSAATLTSLDTNIPMIVTIRNLTGEPIIAETYPTSSRPSTNLVLQPSCRLTTKLPRGELVLRAHSCTDVPKLAFSDNEKAPLILKEGWHFDPVGHKISLSTIFTASWNVVPLPHDSIWRIFSFKV